MTLHDSETLSRLNAFGRQTILMAARSMGLDGSIQGDYVNLGGDLAARCVILDTQPRAGSPSINVGVELIVGADRQRVIRTAAAGFGRSEEEAVLQSVQIIIEGGVPPVLAATGSEKAAWSGMTTTPDGDRQVFWEAFEGPLQLAGKDKQAWAAYLKSWPIMPLFGSPPAFGAGPLSWLQVSINCQPQKGVEAECSLNGRVWKQGLEFLREYQCPPAHGQLFCRQFFVIRAQLV